MIGMDTAEAREVFGYLKATPLFTYFEEEALRDLLRNSRLIRCDTTERVIQEGEVGPEFYLVGPR